MATVVTPSYKQIEVKTIDADWTSPVFLNIASIKFIPGAANDKVTILSGSDAGPLDFYSISLDGEPRVEYFDPPKRSKPCIDLSASTFSAGHKVIFNLAD